MIIFLKANYPKAMTAWYIANGVKRPTYQVVIIPADKLKLQLGIVPDELNVTVHKTVAMSPAPGNRVILKGELYALYSEGGTFKLKKVD